MDEDEWCVGELKGDPDISGIGVVTSIWATTFISILISWILWYLALWRGKTKKNRLFRAFTKCAYVLADIHLLTALAIILSSTILIYANGDTSLYHVFVARCLAQANFTGHGAALIFDTRSQSNWTLRVWLLVITLVAYFHWSRLGITEFNDWENRTPKCFDNSDLIPFWYTTWMYIDPPWQALGWLRVFLEATGKFQHHLIRWNHQTAQLLRDAIDDFVAAFATENLMEVPKKLTLSALKLASFLVIALTLFPPSTAPFASSFYLIWQSYDIFTVRSYNKTRLVASPESFNGRSLQYNVNPEDDFGFGQLLPWFLLSLPLLQFWDIFTESEDHEDRVSYYYREGGRDPGWSGISEESPAVWPAEPASSGIASPRSVGFRRRETRG